MKSHPDIQQLKDQRAQLNIVVSKPFDELSEDLFYVYVTINNKHWKVLVDDEYQDFSEDNQLMNWFLVLRSLECYEEADDFFAWSNQFGIDQSTSGVLDYYKSLATTYREMEEVLGKIDSLVSSYDYTLRTGVVDALMSESPTQK